MNLDSRATSLSHLLAWLYEGKYMYAPDGPQKNLRLLAFIEDPMYLIVAVKTDSGIEALAQARA